MNRLLRQSLKSKLWSVDSWREKWYSNIYKEWYSRTKCYGVDGMGEEGDYGEEFEGFEEEMGVPEENEYDEEEPNH